MCNPENLKKIAAGNSPKMMSNALMNSARYIESLRFTNGDLVRAALEIIRTEAFSQDHPQRIAAHKALRAAVRK